MDDCLPKQLLWTKRSDGWRCPCNIPKKQWKDQVAVGVMTHTRDPLMMAVNVVG